MEKRSQNLIINIMIIIVLISISILFISPSLIYLSYNLFLALIPLFLSIIILRKDLNIILKIVFGILWILFFPNAIYLFTDIIHLSNIDFYGMEVYNITYNMEFVIWYKLTITVLSALVGMMISYISFQNVTKAINIQPNSVSYNIILFVVSLLSGVAIFIGRFIRLNSWDAITNFGTTIDEIRNILFGDNLYLALLFGIFQFMVIIIFNIINKRR